MKPGKFIIFSFLIRSVVTFTICIVFLADNLLFAQCPPNLDFENGNFTGWTLYTGSVAAVNLQNVITLSPVAAPVPGRHEMLSMPPGNGLDEYGGFPKNSPNGSKYSLKLGNDLGGNQAEAASYEFTIPPNSSKFSLTYYYAVVIQDPGHQDYQQPRLVIDVLNVTDNMPIGCSSFSFVPDGEMPGFMVSPRLVNNTTVLYKPWAANSINLDGYEGKTIRIFFKNADCTFITHFGYAYVDISTECSSSFVGAAYCPGDTAVNIKAPFGYQKYKWYNETFTQLLDSGQVLHLSPPPPSGTNVKVVLTPFLGYGCVDTLTASLLDTMTIRANAGEDKVSCNGSVEQIGAAPVPGLTYKWSPSTGLNDTDISNPLVTVSSTTTYILRVQSEGGGCSSLDTVTVRSDFLDNSIAVSGDTSYCDITGQAAVLQVHSADSIQWFKDGTPIYGAVQMQYTATESGAYYATLFSHNGCILNTAVKNIKVYPVPVAGFTVNNNAQCLLGNQFSFTNLSHVSAGTLTYDWDMGNGTRLTARDITYSYQAPGNYTVTLTIKGNGGCSARKSMDIKVLPNALANFTASPVCVNLPVPLVNNSTYSGSFPVNYTWDFGNGQVSNLRDPVYSYPVSGTYRISLSVNTAECMQLSAREQEIIVDTPLAGTRYPDQLAIFNYPLMLSARQIGSEVLWLPSTNLGNNRSFSPVFKGITDQNYTIRISTKTGCVTTDTQRVKTLKKIEIHVPGAFTPDGDGKNDYLRPLLYGFSRVNYFRVYNRWGKLFYASESDFPGWNGKVNNVPQEMQTVIWTIEAVDVDGIIHREKGSTILLR